MKVVIEREELFRGIGSVLDVVPSKTALPVLSNIMIEAEDGGGLRLSATDLDVSIKCTLSATVDVSGSTTVPARKFSEIVRELPDEEVSLIGEDGKVTLRRKGGEGIYSLACLPAEDFPELPKEIEGAKLTPEDWLGTPDNGHILKDMIFKTVFAVSRDETRPVLNGVLWQVKGDRMTMVATDGHRLIKHTKSLAQPPGGEASEEAIVPPRALNHLVKLMSAGSKLDLVQFGQNHLMFHLCGPADGGETHLFTRLIEGPFVDYEQVIPRDNPMQLKVSGGQLSPAVRRVSVLSSAQTHQVRLKLVDNQVELSADSQEVGGEAQERLEANYSGDEMTIGYNASYLLDILRRIDSEEVLFELESAVTAGIIRPAEQPEGEDYLCLIMPLRLND